MKPIWNHKEKMWCENVGKFNDLNVISVDEGSERELNHKNVVDLT